MQQKVQSIYRNLCEDFLYSGVYSNISSEERKQVIRFNIFIFLAFLANLVAVGSYFSHGLYVSALINITSAYFFLVAYYLNNRRKLAFARMLSIINTNLYVVVISIVEGWRAGEYFYFFPYFLILTFLLSLQKDYWQLFFIYLIGFISIMLCIYLSPAENHLQPVIKDMYPEMYNTNLVISLVLTIIFSFAILRVNRDHERAILQEKAFGDIIYNTSLDAAFIVDQDTFLISSYNKRTIEMFEVKDVSHINLTNFKDWLEEKYRDKLVKNMKWLSENNKTWQGELLFTSPEGRQLHGYVSIIPFRYKKRRLFKVRVLDITDLKVAEFELIKSKEKAEVASRAKSRFLSNMSHELRTPLNGIIGASNLLMQEDYSAKQKPYLDILRHASEHMMALVNDILETSKIEAGKMQLRPEPMNLATFCKNIDARYAHLPLNDQTSYHSVIDPTLDVEVLADGTRLQQVLDNLLSNAAKFTPEGSITFSCRCFERHENLITILFEVTDTGIGIPADRQADIFESFTQLDEDSTRKYGGTGLGLSISKKLVRLFGSELRVESEPGIGSRFYFSIDLPVHHPVAFIAREEQPENLFHLQSLHGLKLLIAEDNEVNMIVASRFLNKWGIEVVAAVNGREAVEKFRRGQYDLLLLDLEMPVMDGTNALSEIRKMNQTIPAVAFTAAVYDNMYSDLRSKGFDDFIHKPFRPQELYQKIHNLVYRLSA